MLLILCDFIWNGIHNSEERKEKQQRIAKWNHEKTFLRALNTTKGKLKEEKEKHKELRSEKEREYFALTQKYTK